MAVAVYDILYLCIFALKYLCSLAVAEPVICVYGGVVRYAAFCFSFAFKPAGIVIQVCSDGCFDKNKKVIEIQI